MERILRTINKRQSDGPRQVTHRWRVAIERSAWLCVVCTSSTLGMCVEPVSNVVDTFTVAIVGHMRGWRLEVGDRA